MAVTVKEYGRDFQVVKIAEVITDDTTWSAIKLLGSRSDEPKEEVTNKPIRLTSVSAFVSRNATRRIITGMCDGD